MPGQMRPKSMSTEEAAEWIANPPPASAVPTPPEDEFSAVREALRAAELDGEPTEIEHEMADEWAARMERERIAKSKKAYRGPPRVPRMPEPEPGYDPADLRALALIEQDIEVVMGPGALGCTPEQRHIATLRLIQDLSEARELIEILSQLVDETS